MRAYVDFFYLTSETTPSRIEPSEKLMEEQNLNKQVKQTLDQTPEQLTEISDCGLLQISRFRLLFTTFVGLSLSLGFFWCGSSTHFLFSAEGFCHDSLVGALLPDQVACCEPLG